jgi:hypothetical protein
VELDVDELVLDDEMVVLDEDVEDEVDEDVEDEVDDDVDVVDELVVVVPQPQVVMTWSLVSTYAKPAGLLAEPSFAPLSMTSLFELLPLTP